MKNKVFIGCSGFSERLWKGFFYPDELPSKEYLSFYSKHLNAVEINSTFYRKPTETTLKKWVNDTGDDFKFFIKIPKTISHLKKLENTKDETTLFCDYISSTLKGKLGGFLFQLPPSFKYSDENLERVLQTVNSKYLNVIEFRDSSWWTNEIQNILKDNKIVFSGVSIPKDIPDDFVINSERFSYYRLHGIPQLFKSEYSEEDLTGLARKIESFKGTSFIFFNNTYGIAGIKNAIYLNNILKKIE